MLGIERTAIEAYHSKHVMQQSPLQNRFSYYRKKLMHSILNKLITSENIQILVLGAGLDDTYEHKYPKNRFFIVDLPNVIKLRKCGTNACNIAGDLRNIDDLIESLNINRFERNVETIIVLEFVLPYIGTDAVAILFQKLNKYIENSILVLYEPIFTPNPQQQDFYSMYYNKFDERGAPLLHVNKTVENNILLLQRCGWFNTIALSQQEALNSWLDAADRVYSIGDEPFDEYSSLAILNSIYYYTITFNSDRCNDKIVREKLSLATRIKSIESRINALEAARNALNIRESSSQDVVAVSDVVAQCFAEYCQRYNTIAKFIKKSLTKLPRDISNCNEKKTKFWVLTDKNIVIGTIGIRFTSNSTAEIMHMCVAPTHRKKGYGSKLLLHALNYFERIPPPVSLQLSVMDVCTQAKELYLKNGFVISNYSDLGENCGIVHMTYARPAANGAVSEETDVVYSKPVLPLFVSDEEDGVYHSSMGSIVYKTFKVKRQEPCRVLTGVSKPLLFADAVWPGSKVIADFLTTNSHMYRNKTILELGCGECALPSLVVLKILAPTYLCITDYPSDDILSNVNSLLKENKLDKCANYAVQGLEWGNKGQIRECLSQGKVANGYELIIQSELLWKDTYGLHRGLLETTQELLAPNGTVLVAYANRLNETYFAENNYEFFQLAEKVYHFNVKLLDTVVKYSDVDDSNTIPVYLYQMTRK